jgi:hypothetical protein
VDGSIEGKFTDKRTGEALAGALGEYRAMPKVDYQKRIERSVGRSVAGSTTDQIEVEDERDQFLVRGHFVSHRFSQRPQPRMLIFKAGLLEADEWRLVAKTRKYPVVVDTDALSDMVRIQLPAEFKVDELPEAIKIDSPYGKYQATWAFEGGAILFKQTIEIPAQTVAPEKYAELKKFLDTVSSAANEPVVLKQ